MFHIIALNLKKRKFLTNLLRVLDTLWFEYKETTLTKDIFWRIVVIVMNGLNEFVKGMSHEQLYNVHCYGLAFVYL